MVARVLYNYNARTDEELSIQEGSIILITNDTDNEWWSAIERPVDTFEEARSGLIPLMYVEEVLIVYKAIPISIATALYDYEPQTDEEIAIREGGMIKVYDKLDNDWWFVKYDNDVGLIPATYVKEQENKSSGHRPQISNNSSVEDAEMQKSRLLSALGGLGFDKVKPETKAMTGILYGPDDIIYHQLTELDSMKKKNNHKGLFGVSQIERKIYFLDDITKEIYYSIDTDSLIKYRMKKTKLLIEYANESREYEGDKEDIVKILGNIEVAVNSKRPVFINQNITPLSDISGDVPTTAVSMLSSKKIATALYDYKPVDQGEVEIFENDMLVVLDMSDVDWWLVKHLKSREQGLVPRTYLQIPGVQKQNIKTIDQNQDKQNIAKIDQGIQLQREREIQMRQKLIIEEEANEQVCRADVERKTEIEHARRQREEKEIERDRLQAGAERERIRIQDEENARERIRIQDEENARERVLSQDQERLKEESQRSKTIERNQRKESLESPSIPKIPARPQIPIREAIPARVTVVSPTIPARPNATSPQAINSQPVLPNRPTIPNRPAEIIEPPLVRRIERPIAPVSRPKNEIPIDENSSNKPNASKLRSWQDKTGKFTVEAAYIGVLENKVQLHKINGVIIAVPLDKLNDEAIIFVKSQPGNENLDVGPKVVAPSPPILNFSSAIIAPEETRSLDYIFNGFDWRDWLIKAGIPSTDASIYAKLFVQQRLDANIIGDMDREALRAMNIAEGDIIRIRKAANLPVITSASRIKVEQIEADAQSKNLQSLHSRSSTRSRDQQISADETYAREIYSQEANNFTKRSVSSKSDQVNFKTIFEAGSLLQAANRQESRNNQNINVIVADTSSRLSSSPNPKTSFSNDPWGIYQGGISITAQSSTEALQEAKRKQEETQKALDIARLAIQKANEQARQVAVIQEQAKQAQISRDADASLRKAQDAAKQAMLIQQQASQKLMDAQSQMSNNLAQSDNRNYGYQSQQQSFTPKVLAQPMIPIPAAYPTQMVNQNLSSYNNPVANISQARVPLQSYQQGMAYNSGNLSQPIQTNQVALNQSYSGNLSQPISNNQVASNQSYSGAQYDPYLAVKNPVVNSTPTYQSVQSFTPIRTENTYTSFQGDNNMSGSNHLSRPSGMNNLLKAGSNPMSNTNNMNSHLAPQSMSNMSNILQAQPSFNNTNTFSIQPSINAANANQSQSIMSGANYTNNGLLVSGQPMMQHNNGQFGFSSNFNSGQAIRSNTQMVDYPNVVHPESSFNSMSEGQMRNGMTNQSYPNNGTNRNTTQLNSNALNTESSNTNLYYNGLNQNISNGMIQNTNQIYGTGNMNQPQVYNSTLPIQQQQHQQQHQQQQINPNYNNAQQSNYNSGYNNNL